MSGAASEDNPVGINVTAMVDVIFCLCLFFMCSMHFRQLEGAMGFWLPKDRSGVVTPINNPMRDEVRVRLRWNGSTVVRSIGTGNAASDIVRTLHAMEDALIAAGYTMPAIIIESDSAVPWRDIVRVMDECRIEGWHSIALQQSNP